MDKPDADELVLVGEMDAAGKVVAHHGAGSAGVVLGAAARG